MNERVYKWDWLKLVLIFLVVVGHLFDRTATPSVALQRVDYWIYLFHMPAFIFVSGLFAKRNIQLRRFDKIFTLLIYYFITKIMVFLIQYGVHYPTVPKFSLLSESGVPWYLLAMFWFELIAIAFDRFDHRFMLGFFIVIACVAPYDRQLGDVLVVARTLGFMPFFYLGYMIDPVSLAEWLQALWKRLAGGILLVLAFVGICAVFPHLWSTWGLLTSRSSYAKMGQVYLHYGPLLRLIVGVGSMTLVTAIAAIVPSKKGRLACLGAKTLQIYVFHMLIIWMLTDWLHLDRIIGGIISSQIASDILIGVIVIGVCASKPISWMTKCCFPKPKRELAGIESK